MAYTHNHDPAADPDDSDDQDAPAFQRLRKQTGKVIKHGDRLQASKEFGKRIHKMQKQRRRYEGSDKP